MAITIPIPVLNPVITGLDIKFAKNPNLNMPAKKRNPPESNANVDAADKYPDTSSEELKQKLRIGEVYFAAPDTAFEPFIERYLKFRDIVERTTINLNENDAVLKLSAFQNGVSRLGKPDAAEISEKERDILIDWLKSPKLNVIDVGKSEPLHLGKAQDSWYSHPWVSADVLMLLLFNLDPIERGLHEYWIDEVAKTYRFPPDYDVNLRRIVDENRNMLEERVRIKHGQ